MLTAVVVVTPLKTYRGAIHVRVPRARERCPRHAFGAHPTYPGRRTALITSTTPASATAPPMRTVESKPIPGAVST